MMSRETLTLTLKDEQALLAAYMPLLDQGGIFVPTCDRYELGRSLDLHLTLPGETMHRLLTGEVVWVSPEGVTGQRVPGVGLHFSHADQSLREHIETLLADQLNENVPNYTL